MWRAMMVVTLAIVVVACGGGDGAERQLHLPGGVISEGDYRASIRAGFLDLRSRTMCASLRGLSGREAFQALEGAELETIIESVPDADIYQMSVAELEARLVTLEGKRDQLIGIATVAASSDGDRAGRPVEPTFDQGARGRVDEKGLDHGVEILRTDVGSCEDDDDEDRGSAHGFRPDM